MPLQRKGGAKRGLGKAEKHAFLANLKRERDAWNERRAQERERAPNEHDVLVINNKDQLYQFPVDRDGAVGEYKEPPKPIDDANANGRRKVMRAIAPRHANPKQGIAFATLPVKPEPASGHFSCYLINAQSLNYKNPWITADWTGASDNGEPEPQPWADAKIEVLIAGGNGRVYYVHITPGANGDFAPQESVSAQGEVRAREVDLRNESELWQALRNGAVAGAVRYEGEQQRVVPIVNLSSLQRGPGKE